MTFCSATTTLRVSIEYQINDQRTTLCAVALFPKAFYGSDSLFVPPGYVNVSITPATVAQANHLNCLRFFLISWLGRINGSLE